MRTHVVLQCPTCKAITDAYVCRKCYGFGPEDALVETLPVEVVTLADHHAEVERLARAWRTLAHGGEVER